MPKFTPIDPAAATRPELVDYMKAQGIYAGHARDGVDQLRAVVAGYVADHAAAAPAAPARELHTHCTNCGYAFKTPRASGLCKTAAACAARKASGDPTARTRTRTGKAKSTADAEAKIARINEAKAEKTALDAWKATRNGQPPATPVLDAMKAERATA